MTGSWLRTGQVAEAAGVNQQTLRYYERRGLLSEPDRTPGRPPALSARNRHRALSDQGSPTTRYQPWTNSATPSTQRSARADTGRFGVVVAR